MDELIERISFATGMPESDIKDRIEEKKHELSGLISDEGAAYVVAREIGVDLVPHQRLHLESIAPGMQNVDVIGKITKILPIREFSTEKARGRVANLFIADETASARLSLWNEETNKLSGFSEGDVIRVKGYVKTDNLGGPEIRLGRYGIIAKSDDIVASTKTRQADRSTIVGLTEGQHKELKAAIVQVFEGNAFYEICPECKARLKEETEYQCPEHGGVAPDFGLVISCIIDDGSGNIRAIFFNEHAEKLLGMKRAEAKKLFDRKKKLEAVLEKVPLGRDLILAGRVRHNNFFDRLEFSVTDVKDADIKKEIEIMLNRLNG